MPDREYLLDANIVIKLWKRHPNLLDKIDEVKGINYKITKNIAGELSTKEYRDYNGVPILTDKFMRLLDHIIEIEESIFQTGLGEEAVVKYDANKKIYYINDNKLSVNDYSLIALCRKYEQYTLVTEDKQIFSSAGSILGSSRVLDFNGFINELNNLHIL